MDPILVVAVVILIAVFAPIGLMNFWFARQDYDESRVLWR